MKNNKIEKNSVERQRERERERERERGRGGTWRVY